MKRIMIIGAGFAGATCARKCAEAGFEVELVENRNHIGGNAYDHYDEHGILIHKYGPHIFHTNDKRIVEFLSQFTDWRFYEHRVLVRDRDRLIPFPINRLTLKKVFGRTFNENEAKEHFESVRVDIQQIKTSEDVVLSSVGHDLCELFFRGYTKKQWGIDLSDLSAGVAARIPTRTNDDTRYFTDTYQLMPLEGYTELFKRMLNHPNIQLRLGEDFFNIKDNVDVNHTIYTGKVDQYFDYKYGQLPYRSLKFKHEHLKNEGHIQAVGTVNYPNEEDFTRITEFKHLTGQEHPSTSTVKEFPCSDGDPFYPIPQQENWDMYKKYERDARSLSDVTFVGRLAEYRYYNMDQVVASALSKIEKLTLGS